MLAFHACPPPGAWLNDPNALSHDGVRYRLMAQHRADGAAETPVNWGGFASDDLVRWEWKGVSLAGTAAASAYSGDLVDTGDGGRELFHTRHAAGPVPVQTQMRSIEMAGGWHADPPGGLAIAPARNRRDPFVFAHAGGWRMLLAEPCDWHRWADEAPSRLLLLASEDRIAWREAGRIGPAAAPGLMWECPALREVGDVWALIVGEVDRRDAANLCVTRYWLGAFDGAAFTAHPGQPPRGRPLDLGPDCYAAKLNLEARWPEAATAMIAWASSWATARAMDWPGFHGGPLTLPRRLERVGGALVQTPLAPRDSFAPAAAQPPAGRLDARHCGRFRIEARTVTTRLTIEATAAALIIGREGPPGFAWHAAAAAPPAPGALTLFVDGPLVECFVGGETITAALPGGAPVITTEGLDAPAWSALAR